MAAATAIFLMSTNSPCCGKDYLGDAALVLSPYLLTGICFPALILGLASWQTAQPAFGRRFGWLGDISYACYLWHFPLLLGVFCLGMGLGKGVAFFNHGALLAAFAVVLIGVSLASYHWLERPAQARLRAAFSPRRQSPVNASA